MARLTIGLACTCLDETYGEPRREIVDEEELESVESTFEYDQFFFLHVLPPPKKRIYSPKRNGVRSCIDIECPSRVHVCYPSGLSPLEVEKMSTDRKSVV